MNYIYIYNVENIKYTILYIMENENIRNIAKDLVEEVINKSLKNIELVENMNCHDKPLTPIVEETDSDTDNTNKFIPINEDSASINEDSASINEDSALIDITLDDDIDLDAIKRKILYEKAKREKKSSSITILHILKRLCCCCIK